MAKMIVGKRREILVPNKTRLILVKNFLSKLQRIEEDDVVSCFLPFSNKGSSIEAIVETATPATFSTF